VTAPPAGKPLRVLLVEDDDNDAFLVTRRLERDGFAPAIQRVLTASAMRAALDGGDFDVVISDFTMPGFDALQALGVLGQTGKDLPFIVVSGTIGEETAVQAMKAGAHDYFSKSHLERLAPAIEREMREARVRRDRSEALARERATEERLRLVVDSVKEYAIFTLDTQGRVASWHPGAGRVYGYAEADVVGRPFARFFHADDVESGKPDQILARARAEGSCQVELFQVCKDGSMFWAEATLAKLRHEDERLRGFSVVVRDITQQVKLLEELRVAVRSRDEFLSMASHELRTPVTTLQLQIQTLRRALEKMKEAAPTRVAQRMATLERQTNRIVMLVSELLDISRMRLGRFELKVEEVDLAELARGAVERLRGEAERARCALSLRVDARVTGWWDRMRLEQLITNLVTNALKFGEEKPVVVSVGGDEDRAWIAVEDRGIGIAQQDQSRVFGRFERAVPSENYGGLGLGLYIAREIVEAHGGTISLRSAPGAGSTFTVELLRDLHAADHGDSDDPPRDDADDDGRLAAQGDGQGI
jgi:PAS domain S-box-containing protein